MGFKWPQRIYGRKGLEPRGIESKSTILGELPACFMPGRYPFCGELNTWVFQFYSWSYQGNWWRKAKPRRKAKPGVSSAEQTTEVVESLKGPTPLPSLKCQRQCRRWYCKIRVSFRDLETDPRKSCMKRLSVFLGLKAVNREGSRSLQWAHTGAQIKLTWSLDHFDDNTS